MGNRIKEEERIEKMIRSLMKLPDNRRCINCNNLGPQYVCTTFSTFICTNCSGIHREFTHRVKSVSMAKFSPDEVLALQAGGNERARQVLFRYWELHSDTIPDGSNLQKLRDFIKAVYIERKYAGERHCETGLSRLKTESLRSRDKPIKIPAFNSNYHSRTRHEEDLYERPHIRRVGKSLEPPTNKLHHRDPKFSPNSRADPRNGGQKQKPVKFEVVDDRFRDDGFGSRRFSVGDGTVLPRRLSCSDTDTKQSRPLEEILGEKFPSLPIGEVSKESSAERSDSSASNQESATTKPMENKIEIPQNLIDFDTETEPTHAAAAAAISQTQKKSSANTSGSQTPDLTQDTQASKEKTLESLLFELSVPSPVIPVNDAVEEPGTDIVIYTSPAENTVPSGSALIPQLMDSADTFPDQPSKESLLLATDDEWLFSDGVSTLSKLTLPIESSNSELSVLVERTEIGFSGFCGEELSQTATGPLQNAIPGTEHQLLIEEANPTGRMELPADLFNASYPPMAAPVSGLPNGMSFNYYPYAMSVPTFPNQPKSTNPFDISNEQSQFPSMASTQGVPTGSLYSSNLGVYPQLQANTYTMIPHHMPFAAPPFSPCGYTRQEVHNNFQPIRPQGIGGFGNGNAVFVSGQQPATLYSEPANPSSSIGGNPFG